MNRARIFTVFLVAIVAGGGLAYGTYDYLQNVPVKTVTVPTKRVVVANADLSLGTSPSFPASWRRKKPAAACPQSSRPASEPCR
jgi:hypothetical protein